MVAFFWGIFKVVFAVTFFAAGQVEALCIRISSLAYLGTTSPIDSWRFWMPEHKVMSNIELDRWSRAVKQAAERIRYDSPLEVARQLGVDSEPLQLCHSTSRNDLLVGSTMKIFLWVRSSRMATRFVGERVAALRR